MQKIFYDDEGKINQVSEVHGDLNFHVKIPGLVEADVHVDDIALWEEITAHPSDYRYQDGQIVKA